MTPNADSPCSVPDAAAGSGPAAAAAAAPVPVERWTAQRLKSRVNRILAERTGYELRRSRTGRPGRPGRPGRDPGPPPPTIEKPPVPVDPAAIDGRLARAKPGDRLVTAPVFVLSTVRSGSTLLRLVLDSHADICAPHELHLRAVDVKLRPMARYALGELGVDDTDLRYLLWDRLLHREMARAGKSRYVNKTPNDAMIWAEIAACWPDVKFIHLRRHPGAIMESWQQARDLRGFSRESTAADLHAYTVGMGQALRAKGGLVVRYEDLTGEPERETRRICDYIGVDWSARMLAYGQAQHAGLRRGLGDWSAKVKSGRIQPATQAEPGSVPAALRDVAREWGYLD